MVPSYCRFRSAPDPARVAALVEMLWRGAAGWLHCIDAHILWCHCRADACVPPHQQGSERQERRLLRGATTDSNRQSLCDPVPTARLVNVGGANGIRRTMKELVVSVFPFTYGLAAALGDVVLPSFSFLFSYCVI